MDNDEDDFVAYNAAHNGTCRLHGKVVDPREFYRHITAHAKRDADGNVLFTVEKVETVH